MHALPLLWLSFLPCLSPSSPQDQLPDPPPVHIPSLPAEGADARAFTPPGWVVQVQATGDLNGDGRPDLVFVLHDTDKHNVLHAPGSSAESYDTNPRILAVAFAKPNGGFHLVAQNSKLIPRRDSPYHDDNFGEEGSLTIKRGAFSVGLYYFSSWGGWSTGTTTYTFRWQNNRFELIGAENDNTQRNTAKSTTVSVNYSTGEALITPDTGRTRHLRLPHKPLPTLDNIGDGMEFEIPGVE